MSLYRKLTLISTFIGTFLGGRKVGTDASGNTYYEQRRPVKGPLGTRRARRWVIYKDTYDASAVPPEWHGWLHYTQAAPLSVEGPYHKAWQQDYQPNLTGSSAAYHPPGSQLEGGQRDKATGDYQAWMPN